MDLDGRAVLVTGAGTGLGREVALEMGRAGARVAVNYSRSRVAAEQVADEIEREGGRALAARADVTDRAAVAAMVATVERVLGPVDVLVNNAGITRYIPFPDIDAITEEQWRRILDVNLTGAFLCSQAVAPGMVARSAGKIVNVATNSAFTSTGSSIPYVVSKAALVSLTTCLARALAPDCPGQRDCAGLDGHRMAGPLPPAGARSRDPVRRRTPGTAGGCRGLPDGVSNQRFHHRPRRRRGPGGDAALDQCRDQVGATTDSWR